MQTFAVLHSTIRKEEKLIRAAAESRGLNVKMMDIRTLDLNPKTFDPDFDIALERSVSTTKGNYVVPFLESLGVNVVNSSNIARVCEDKYLTSLLLLKNNVKTIKFTMVFSLEQALRAIHDIGGYPVVMKPPLGSWGRLLSKINDRDALETILDHKDVLGTPPHKAYYLQEYVRKPGRDIRAFVVGGNAICAIYRESSHWITNTAKGGRAYNCPVTPELQMICRQASDAVGGGLLAIDLFETDAGYVVNEINHTMEFKNSEEPTGVSISQAIVDYCILQAQNSKPQTEETSTWTFPS